MTNLAILDTWPKTPSSSALMARTLEPHVLLGMPHLNAHGLSETWLMKELGHRHWLMLARHLGMDDADFRTPDGREVYASISATSLCHAHLGLAGANDILTVRSTLLRISRTQYASRHHLDIRGRKIADVEMVSTFVQRRIEGDNLSLVRMEHGRGVRDAFASSALAAAAAAFRRNVTQSHLGMTMEAGAPLGRYAFRPSVAEDFNGAGLFYFAAFQSVMTRALEAWFPHERLTVSRRDVFMTGNIDGDEALEVELRALNPDRSGLACLIVRADGSRIGTMFALLGDGADR